MSILAIHNNSKQFQDLNFVPSNKTGGLFLEFSWCEDVFKGLKDSK